MTETIFRTLVVITAVLSATSCRHVHEDLDGQNSQAAYNMLVNSGCFAFGPGGFLGVPSAGEVAMRDILKGGSKEQQLQLFRKLLEEGTIAAKLYALCGIQFLDPTSFDECAAPFLAPNPNVSVKEGGPGCIVQVKKMKGADMIREIRLGHFSGHLMDRERNERSLKL